MTKQDYKADKITVFNVGKTQEIRFVQKQRKEELKEYEDEVIKFQRKTFILKKLPSPSWMESLSFSVERDFIPITFSKDQQNGIGIEELISDILNAKKAIIVVEGKQGYGKTTLTYKLISDWALNKNDLSKFKVMFLVEGSSKDDLFDEIWNQMTWPTEEINWIDRKDVMKELSSEMLVLIDGIQDVSKNIQTEILLGKEDNKISYKLLVTVSSSDQNDIIQAIIDKDAKIEIENIQDEAIAELERDYEKHIKEFLNEILRLLKFNVFQKCPELKIGLRFLLKSIKQKREFQKIFAFLVAFFLSRRDINALSQMLDCSHSPFFCNLYETEKKYSCSIQDICNGIECNGKKFFDEDILYLKQLLSHEKDMKTSERNVSTLLQVLQSFYLSYIYQKDTQQFLKILNDVLINYKARESIILPLVLITIDQSKVSDLCSILQTKFEFYWPCFRTCQLMNNESLQHSLIQYAPKHCELLLAYDAKIHTTISDAFYDLFWKCFGQNHVNKLIFRQEACLRNLPNSKDLRDYIPLDLKKSAYLITYTSTRLEKLKEEIKSISDPDTSLALNVALHLSYLANTDFEQFCTSLKNSHFNSITFIEKEEEEDLFVAVSLFPKKIEALITISKDISQEEVTSLMEIIGRLKTLKQFRFSCKKQCKEVNLTTLCSNRKEHWDCVQLHNCNVFVSEAKTLNIKSLTLKRDSPNSNDPKVAEVLEACKSEKFSCLTFDGSCLLFLLNNTETWQGYDTITKLQVHDLELSQCLPVLNRMHRLEGFCWNCPENVSEGDLESTKWQEFLSNKKFHSIELNQAIAKVQVFMTELKSFVESMVKITADDEKFFTSYSLTVTLTKQWTIEEFTSFLDKFAVNLKIILERKAVQKLTIKLFDYVNWSIPPLHFIAMKDKFGEFNLCFLHDDVEFQHETCLVLSCLEHF